MSLVPKDMLSKRERLSKMVDDAYRKGDHKTAERLDSQLEELDDKIDGMLADMDDSDGEDIATGNTGGEESHLDKDWSVQEEMARIYARYIAGELDLDDSEITQVDPDEARKKGLQVHQGIDHNGKSVQSFYSYTPITRQRALANMLRGAIWESPNLSVSKPIADKIKSMTDEQIIAVAKDAYEWKRDMRDRIQVRGRNL
jgi:hypothetical protein